MNFNRAKSVPIHRLHSFVGLVRLILLSGFCGFATTLPAGEAAIDVTTFGAKADGETDDTAAIQNAIDSVGPTGGTVLFPPGTYRVTSVGLKAGVRYLGYGATIKRPARQGKWVRTFDSWKPGYQHSSDKDSAAIHIEGFDFDGNRIEQDKYDQHELEQAHLIFLMADPKKAGRLRVRITNCTFRDCVADAISIYTNVEAQISNCTAIDCFRGGMVLGGGHSRVQMTNFVARGKTHPTGIDVEVDGGGFGGDMAVELLMNNVSLPDGDFDVGVLGDSVVLGSKIVAKAPFNVYGGGTARLSFSDCEFGLGDFSGGNRIALPGDMTFRNCRFTVESDRPVTEVVRLRGEGVKDTETKGDRSLTTLATEDAATAKPKPRQFAAAHIYWNISGSDARRQTVRFQDCVFRAANIPDGDLTYGIFTHADALTHGNQLEVTGGEIGPEFVHGVFLSQGGRATIRNTRIAARQALFLGSSDGYFLDALIDGIDVNGARLQRAADDGAEPRHVENALHVEPSYANINTFNVANRITHRNVELDASRNVLRTDYGLVGNSYFGGRVIHGDAAPTEMTHGLLGDRFHVNSAKPKESSEWLCTKTGNGSGAEWKRGQQIKGDDE